MKHKNQNTSIAFVICTRNNEMKLRESLQRALDYLTPNISVYIIDQSKIENFQVLNYSNSHKRKIVYVHVPNQRGHSVAKNTALKLIAEDVIAWTDDDCLITNSYVRELNVIARESNRLRDEKIAGVCGQTLPYLKTKPLGSYDCPCTFSKQDFALVENVCAHDEQVGFGNNMVLFRQTFNKIGVFKEWLGVGSIGENGDDGEFMIRCLISNYKFMYNHDLIIYHNKWLDEDRQKIQSRSYKCGGLVLYGYYTFSGVEGCKEIFKREINDSIGLIKTYIKNMFSRPQLLHKILYEAISEASTLCKGVFLAYWYSKTDKLVIVN